MTMPALCGGGGCSKEEAQFGGVVLQEAKELYISESGVNVCVRDRVREHDQDAPTPCAV